MTQLTKLTLQCPVRGVLKASKKSKDGLTPTEEFYRVEALRHLVGKGYPPLNIKVEPVIKKFGNAGRNSFRSDFVVLDVPVSSIDSSDVDVLLSHAVLLGEIKRDNTKSDYVKSTQVEPMLDFAKQDKCLGLYWDNIEQRVFWQETVDGKRQTREGPLSFLPDFGNNVETKPLTFADTQPSDSLIEVFDRIEDILHQASFDVEKRYEIILQLLLTKVFDEHAYETRPDRPLGVQDFSVLGTPPKTAKENFEKILGKAVSYYEKHLPNKLSNKIPVKPATLIEILKVLAPIRVIHSKRDVVQTFYMKFAKDLYRWDLAQYFTPTTVTDYIVDILNPQFGEHVCDPACGSADFLVAAFRIGRQFNPGYADSVWGVDNSANAVQVSVLNMLLNGDGKTHIKKDDSLENVNDFKDRYDIMVCNPPFGTKIVEKRKDVLRLYDLGFEWQYLEDKWTQTQKLLDVQETGILFAEVCVKQCKPGGRIGLIVPNGYLGNRSSRYRIFREWLLRQTKVAAISSFPRFTFKSSGADVSASVIFLEKRTDPLESVSDDSDYEFAVEMIEKVGWEAGNKKALPIYKRNIEDGSFIISEEGEMIIDSDFSESLGRLRASEATNHFSWLAEGQDVLPNENSWSVPIAQILEDGDLTLDPKRLCRKVTDLRDALSQGEHITLGELVDFLPERTSKQGHSVKIDPSTEYGYVELGDIGYGDFYYNNLRGWELPSRARHFAEEGDIYFGSIWGSVGKWCYIGEGYKNIVITNGCYRCRLKEGKENYLPDLIAYINTEGWAVQMRSFARGSDGLAEVATDDVQKVIIPLLNDADTRSQIEPFVENLKAGRLTVKAAVIDLLQEEEWDITEPSKRPSHIVLV